MNRKSEIKNNITKYILKKGDICCNEDIDRKFVIKHIINLYKEIAALMFEKDEYLSWLNNDLVVFIGYKINLEQKKNKEGIALWNKIDKATLTKGKANLSKIKSFLKEVPLYFLMSFLGYAYYKKSINSQYAQL